MSVTLFYPKCELLKTGKIPEITEISKMSLKGSSYSYKSAAINEYDLNDNLKIRIERVDNNIARLYFDNEAVLPV